MQFQLGKQPDWAGTDECRDVTTAFVEELLSSSNNLASVAETLINRGYAIVELTDQVIDTYSRFIHSFESFCHQDATTKAKYATLFTQNDTFSPNQFHGFSVVSGLKEQFMMRAGGRGTTLTFPSSYDDTGYDMGIEGMKLYQQLDQLCRAATEEATKRLGVPPSQLVKILDPVYNNKSGTSQRNGDFCYTDFMFPGYISSSILDNFHYFNHTSKDSSDENENENENETKEKHEDRFFNNHASHSDSGLMTVVVVTDTPGLEVFDQKLSYWIALEQHIHDYLAKNKLSSSSSSSHWLQKYPHRKYATLFWGDSHVYLQSKRLSECMHRVAKSPLERFSVVFKQRTSPTATAPRYQEDYELASVQLRAVDLISNKRRLPLLLFKSLIFFIIAASILYLNSDRLTLSL